MKFTIDKAAALVAISPVAAVVPDKHFSPVMTNISVEAFADGSVTFRGRSDAVEATSSADAEVQEPGAATIPAATLAEIVRRAKSDTLSFKQPTPDARVEVRGGSSLFRLAPLPISDMPPFPSRDYDGSLEIAGAALADALEKARTSITKGKSANASMLAGVRIAVHGDELHIVATNGHQYVRVRHDRPADWPDALGVTIGAEVLDQFVALAALSRDTPVRLFAKRGNVMLAADRSLISGPTLDSDYPKYIEMADSFTKSINVRMKANRAVFTDALRRILSVGNVWAKSDRGVRIECEPDYLTIIAHSHVGEAMERVPVEDGAPMTLGFNPDFLLPVLDALDGETLTMGLTSLEDRKTAAAVMLEGENPDVLAFAAQRKV